MHRFLIPIICLFLLVACGGSPDFSGDYGAQYLGQPVQLHLEQSDGQLTGQISYGQITGPLEATILADKASGNVNAGLMGRFPFEAQLDGDDALRWKYLLALPGQTQALELNFKRNESAEEPSTDLGSNLDPALVGHWRRTISNSVAGTLPRNNMNVATDIFCTLSGDGTFSFGGAMTGVASPGFTGTTGSADESTGQWKAEGGVLFSRTVGQEQWIPLGRYAISGSSMVLYAGGDKQLWERQ